MRARHPDHEGIAQIDGADVFYEIYDHPDKAVPTILLTQTWQIFPARHWKFAIPFLARHYRVVTYDPVGNGRSSRVLDSERFGDRSQMADAIGVMDATETGTALAVGLSRGGGIAMLLAAFHPERIEAIIAIAPAHPWVRPHEGRGSIYHGMLEPIDNPQGWEKYNTHHWRKDWPDFVDFFSSELCSDPYSTKSWDDAREWMLQTDGELIALGREGRRQIEAEDVERAVKAITMPALIVHGTDDRVVSYASAAELHKRIPHAELVSLDGAGHTPILRYPVKLNLIIKDFADRQFNRVPATPAPRVRRAAKKALMISSPIGLGHARRDLAICDELRKLYPDLQIDWLTQDPVTRALANAGERVHPASALMANESTHIESESGEHDLAVFQALRDMDEIQVANFMICDEVLAEGKYDLVIGDEAWELDHHLHENPNLKKAPYAWLTDFVGFLPMPDRGEREAFVAADYNAEMIEHIERHGEIRDKAIFVGNPDDIVPDRFGVDLPLIRDWTEANYDFSGYVTGFDPSTLGERNELRTEFGYGPDEKICIVSVGGSGVGIDLLRRVVEAAPIARRSVEGLRFVLVTGPRIDPALLPKVEGVEYKSYVDRLYRHLAVADLALVQGGLTTTMELAACGVPFIYVPLRNHFEQNFHVRARLERYGAGRHLDYADLDPDNVAATIAQEIRRRPVGLPVETNGASRAAALISELL